MNQYHQKIDAQRGAVLIVGLVMLLLLTIIGLASIRGSELQEQMAGNMRDHNQAFQASEAALRYGESYLNGASISQYSSTTKTGYFADLNKTGAPYPRPVVWTADQWKNTGTTLAQDTLSNLALQPAFAIEQVLVSPLASNQGGAVDIESLDKMAELEYYRVTSRGVGGTVDSEVVLQSTFIR
ncbi:MAG TPA: PilX N-terminal domain-containing pilus assembly protein [Cellvibrio sp.]|nr:PilX N-terminal domain-containing pilus assembly protein [Cellvibrio sp.]